MNILDIASFPLNGQRLIEASAGTGKTYTITSLYLRLLLERQLQVTQILVVTFTEAATQELRGRIRGRIHEALLWLEGQTADESLAGLLQKYKGQSDAVQRLRDAITRMDEASIYTIHGFCQRSLGDSAFESGALFDNEFITDETGLRLQAARDFWRQTVASAESNEAAWVLQRWQTPSQLLAELGPLLRQQDVRIVPELSGTSIDETRARRDEAHAEFCSLWGAVASEAMALLYDSELLSRSEKNYRKDRLDELEATVNTFIDDDSLSFVLPASFELLTASRIHCPDSHLKRAADRKIPAPQHALFDAAETLARIHLQHDSLRESLFMRDAADRIRAAIERFKQNGRLLFFDDLLLRLDAALGAESGPRLARRLRSQYQVAMIDEFQDTDPTQYRIFQRIYANSDTTGLFMIGDPKQAIYSFRGADVFTYMRARNDTDCNTAHFTLNTNYRSHAGLIDAVNALFKSSMAPFIYNDDIEFNEAKASPDSKAQVEPLCIDGDIPTPILCWHLEMTGDNVSRGSITKDWAKRKAATAAATEIAQLLTQGQSEKAAIGARALQASDIAVLVRDRFEAAAIREALTQAGVASVFISRDSVFTSDEALDLTHLLRGVAEPGNAVLLRTALATRLMGKSAREIDHIYHDGLAWEGVVDAFLGYQSLWNRQGFMLMFYRLMHEQAISARLLAGGDGERRMTNLLQLVELAQQASSARPGIDNLLHWLEAQRQNADGNNEDQQLRMESDENLVQIVTIHKSKGLEYPLVFVPFVWASKEIKKARILSYHDDNRNLVADLGGTQSAGLTVADRERLAEDLRLLYVALTRARYRVYFSWGRINGAEKSALGYLLHPQPDQTGATTCRIMQLDDRAIREDLLAVNNGGGRLLEVQAAPEQGEVYRPLKAADARPRALIFSGHLLQHWRVSSYSGLIMSDSHRADYYSERPDHDQGEQDDEVAIADNELTVFSFPRGAQAGLLLHQLMELIDFSNARSDAIRDCVVKNLQRFGFEGKWAEVVSAWIESILDTPLNAQQNLRLRDVSTDKRLVEMEFHFALSDFSAQALNALLNQHRDEGLRPAALEFPQLSGLMKGFIDLVFEHAGRFYVLDYKTNHLGNRYDSYQRPALQQAIVEHNYDLQYLLYCLALHRYLRQRLPGYVYSSHFGGVYYLFLRGMTPSNGNASGVYFNRPEEGVIEALDQLCQEVGA